MKRFLSNAGKTLILPVIVFVIFSWMSGGRFGLHSIKTILIQTLIPCLLGFGIYLFMKGGLNDVSATSQMILAGMLAALLVPRFGAVGLFVGCVLACLIMGAFGGTILTLLRINPFVITYGLIMIYEALPEFLGFGVAVYIPFEVARFGRYPYNVIIVALCAALMWFICNRTRFFCHVAAVGCEPVLASNSGIHVRRVQFTIYVVAGLFFGVASFLNICYSCSVTRTFNLGTLWPAFQALMGVMVAMQIEPYCGIVIGIIVGQFCMASIFSGLIAAGMPDTMQRVTIGLFLLVVIAYSVKKADILKALSRVFPFLKIRDAHSADITQFNM